MKKKEKKKKRKKKENEEKKEEEEEEEEEDEDEDDEEEEEEEEEEEGKTHTSLVTLDQGSILVKTLERKEAHSKQEKSSFYCAVGIDIF